MCQVPITFVHCLHPVWWLSRLLRGHSQLSTFMKAYTAYARGGGGLGPPYAFPPKINILFLITDNILQNTAHV